MSNTFVTPQIIAREGLMILKGALVAAGLVLRDHSEEWRGKRIGDTVRIRKPASFTAQEFTTTTSVQNITEAYVDLQIEKHFDVTVEVTSKEMTLSLSELREKVIAPQVLALVEAVNGYVLAQYVGIPYFYDAGTSTPAFPDTIAKLALIGKVLDDNKALVTGRNAIISSSAKAGLFGIEAFHSAEKRGDAGTALREASMGRLLGLDWWMDQQVKTHTAGSFSTTGTPAINGAVSAGATTMNVDGGAGTETLKKGDLFTVADVSGQYVVTADATASSGAMTGVTFYPAAPAGGFPNDKAITVKKSHKANLALHRACIALGIVPLELPIGGATGEYISSDNLGIRAVYAYDSGSKKNLVSLDLLAAARTIQPELGARILEAA